MKDGVQKNANNGLKKEINKAGGGKFLANILFKY